MKKEIKKIRKIRENLENNIQELVEQFYEETGLSISDIEITNIYEIGLSPCVAKRKIIKTKIEL